MGMFDFLFKKPNLVESEKEAKPKSTPKFKVIDQEVEVDINELVVNIKLKDGSEINYTQKLQNNQHCTTIDLLTGNPYNYNEPRVFAGYCSKYSNTSYITNIPSLRDKNTYFIKDGKSYEIHSDDIFIINSEIKKVGTHKLINKILVPIEQEG